jgi:hypothetical protein
MKLRVTDWDGWVSQVAGFFGCRGNPHCADFGLDLDFGEPFDRNEDLYRLDQNAWFSYGSSGMLHSSPPCLEDEAAR